MGDTERYGMMLSAGVFAVGLGLVAWEVFEAKRPGLATSDEDVRHFAHQRTRRRIVATMMLALSGLLLSGSRLPHKLGDRPNPAFIIVWMTVFVLILLLLCLAVIDWLATGRYARRQVERLARERLALLQEEARLRTGRERGGNTDGNGAVPH